MSSNFGHSSPPVFMVDSGGGHPKPHRYYHQQVFGQDNPPPVPCWTFPPARAEVKRRRWGTMNTGMTWIFTLILLLVFVALGLGAYKLLRLQTEVERLSQKMPAQIQSISPQRQVGLKPEEGNKMKTKTAAHVIGRADQSTSSGTLQWEVRLGDAFTDGIKYINGGLQVNESGLYFVYSRVEFLASTCKPTDSLTHTVNVLRDGRNKTVMEDHQEGFCITGAKRPWMTGSHLSSLQRLKQSDWLFVNVSHPSLLSQFFHNNYFGLFKVHLS